MILISAVTVILNKTTSCCISLWLLVMHHLIKFGYKKLSSLEDTVFTKFHDHMDMGQCGHEILSLKKI